MMTILREVDDHRRFSAEIAKREAERQEVERQRQEAEERRLAEEERQRQEQARVDGLIEAANDWHTSNRLRSYLEEVRAAVIERDGHIEDGGKIGEWFEWAESVAKRLNPLSEIHPQRVNPAKPR